MTDNEEIEIERCLRRKGFRLWALLGFVLVIVFCVTLQQ